MRSDSIYSRFVKRVIDILAGVILLAPFALAVIFIAPAILIDDPGPVFYAGERLGRKGRIFRMVKFRSMKVNAPDIRNADGSTYNAGNDGRVTKVGRFLRETSLDELPQILNIIKGDMSFVGPRPDLPDHMNQYDGYNVRKLNVRPGITGLAQAFYRNNSTIKEKFDIDARYADEISFKLDAIIVFKTIGTVVKRENIYRNASEDIEDNERQVQQ